MIGLRGNYEGIGADFVVEQDLAAYSRDEHALFDRLLTRQADLLKKYACRTYREALARLDLQGGVPDFVKTSVALSRATGWNIVGVPGLIPDDVFFNHLAQRRFPVTVWLRTPAEMDYIVEPDVFHDFFGHVPLLFDPTYADHMQEYGKGGLKALRLNGLKFLARLYWFTIEFGLIRENGAIKAYGAGLLSSAGEMPYAIADTKPERVLFDAMTTMATPYDIDRYQNTYFVIDSFEHLMAETAPDFTPHYAALNAR